MDIGKLLSDLKGKVLDASHFDLLKHAYELQEQNIIQLKSNNDALRESNDLIKDKLDEYSNKIEKLEEENSSLSRQFKNQGAAEEDIFLSDNAIKVLKKIVEADTTEFHQKEIIDALGIGRINAQAALDELSEKELIECVGAHRRRGLHYYLTSKAKKELTSAKQL